MWSWVVIVRIQQKSHRYPSASNKVQPGIRETGCSVRNQSFSQLLGAVRSLFCFPACLFINHFCKACPFSLYGFSSPVALSYHHSSFGLTVHQAPIAPDTDFQCLHFKFSAENCPLDWNKRITW